VKTELTTRRENTQKPKTKHKFTTNTAVKKNMQTQKPKQADRPC